MLQALARDLNVAKAAGKTREVAAFAAELRGLAGVLGILEVDPELWLQTRPTLPLTGDATPEAPGGGATPAAPDAQEVEKLVGARTAARKARDFKESDRIRDELLARGVVLEDGPAGTSWRWR